MNIKKNVLIVSAIGGGLFIFLLTALLVDFCGQYRNVCKVIYTPVAYIFFSFPFIFLLSLLTYWMKNEVFHAWWSFARWWVPVIIGVTLLLGNMGGGGTLGMNKDFTAFILIILYSIFIITSLVKIVRTYLRTK